jgi:hypothetical protein
MSASARSRAVTTTELVDGDFVDDIAIERCVAGTLPGGTGMSEPEKEIAVVRLHQLGYPNPEITRRVGVSIGAIRPILRRHGRLPNVALSYQLAVPTGCTAGEARQVRLLIASRVHDHTEARALLLALGLAAVVARATNEATT